MLDCNIYALKDKDDKLCIIDTGNGRSMDPTIEALTKFDLNPKNITTVLITHEHLDHVLGLYALVDMLGKDSIEIYAHPLTAKILREGNEEKIAPRSLGISAANFGVEISKLDVEDLNMAKTFSFGEFEFKMYDTPGHSEGSVSFYDPSHKLLFPGDVVFPQGSFGRYDFPGGDLSILQKSVGKLNELKVDNLCAGHMPPVIGSANKSIARSYKNIRSIGSYF